MTSPIIIGTRGSELALWQANAVAKALLQAGFSSELRIIQTSGDRRRDVPLAQLGGKGVFVVEIEEQLRRGTIDLAVHSLKDIPSKVADDLLLAGFLERDDARDAWLHPEGAAPESLPEGSRVGTSSPRRRAQLLAIHPSLQAMDIRGNVDSRIRKMHDGAYEAIVLAAAGLRRLHRDDEITNLFDVQQMTPAAGQGIIAIEVCKERADLIETAEAISHKPTVMVARCERSFLEQFEGTMDCYTSIAAHATLDRGEVHLRVFLSDASGAGGLRGTYQGSAEASIDIAGNAARDLIARGALELLAGARA